jgi:hypothetical protein
MGAPASFSRLMDMLLADAENVLTYIDNVLVHSRSHKKHLKPLSDAMDKIGAANLRLNPKKCVFGSDLVEYLGHTLSGDGVRPGQNKANAMQTAQPQRSVKELRSFCGLANYFRSYIVLFAIKAAPLFRLTRQESDWKGGELPPEASKAFLRLRDEISSRQVMAYPNATGQYHLFVDAALVDKNNLGGAGSGPDAGSRRRTQGTGGICIKEIRQARTELPGISSGDAGSSLWDGTITSLPHNRKIRVTYRP